MDTPASSSIRALIARWQARRQEFAEFSAHVDGARLCDLVLADLAQAARERTDELLTLAAAARISGYTRDHLARMVRRGQIIDRRVSGVGRIVVRRSDLPLKHESVHVDETTDGHGLASRLYRGKGADNG